MHRTVVLDVVGLTPDLIGESTPNLVRLRHATRIPIVVDESRWQWMVTDSS